MELISNHIQLFVSLVLILGAAVVAVVCDLLKSNNEHLREMNAELRMRVEISHPMLAHAGIPAGQIQPAPMAMISSSEAPAEERVSKEIAEQSLERSAGLTTRRGIAPQKALSTEAAEPAAAGASMAEARMLARELIGRAAKGSTTAKQVTERNANEIIQPEVVIDRPAETPAVHTTTATEVKPARKDWSRLLNSARGQSAVTVTVETAPKTRMAELIPFETIQNSSHELTVPAGFHEGMMLARILNGEKTVRGLVVVIGLNNFATRRHNAGELGAETMVASVSDQIRSMLGTNDFACQSSDDEFLMICPDDRDAKAQRRLSELAELLWDYQLRAVGTSEILLSWGGVEAKGEPFADVVASAAERMRETRRSRRSLGMPAPQKRAV